MAKIKKAQYGIKTSATADTTKKETLAEKNARTMKGIDALEKRIAAKDSIGQKKSYTNQRANKVVGKYKMGGKLKAKKK